MNIEDQEAFEQSFGTTIYGNNGLHVTHCEYTSDGMGGHDELVAGCFYDVMIGNRKVAVDFQHKTVSEDGVNGLTNEALLSILIHRTKTLDDKFPCNENKQAIEYMENALNAFESRTRDRVKRGVEGKHEL